MFQEEAFKVAEGKYLLDAGNQFLKLFKQVVASLVSAQNNLLFQASNDGQVKALKNHQKDQKKDQAALKNLKDQKKEQAAQKDLQFKKWELRRQMHKAVLFNLKKSKQELSEESRTVKRILQLILRFQAKIARRIVEEVSGFLNVQQYLQSGKGRVFLERESFNESVLVLIEETFNQIWTKIFGQAEPPSEDIKNYIIGEFRCLFNLSIQNYSQNGLKKVQQRYAQGMVNEEIAFNVTPVTAQVFKFIFKSPHSMDSIAATKRIGKSHAVLLARILYSYYANSADRFLFFENLLEFKQIFKVNRMLVRMIRNCLFDQLERQHLYILNASYLESMKKDLYGNRISKEKLYEAEKLNESCHQIYQQIKDIQSDFTFGRQQKTVAKQLNIEKTSFSFKTDKQMLHLIHFQNLLNLIGDLDDSATLVVDQFNYPGRLLYQIIAQKLEESPKIKQIAEEIRKIALIKDFINCCNGGNIRFLASIHNFAFQKLVKLMGRSCTLQVDSYSTFGFYFSGQSAKYQLQFQLKKSFKALTDEKKTNFKDFYQKLLKKEFVNEIFSQISLSLSGQGIRILAQKLVKLPIQLYQEQKKVQSHQDRSQIDQKNSGQQSNKQIQIQDIKIKEKIKSSIQSVEKLDKSYAIQSFGKFFKQHTSNDIKNLKLLLLLKFKRPFMKYVEQQHNYINSKQLKLKEIQQFNIVGQHHKLINIPQRRIQFQRFKFITTFLGFFQFYFKQSSIPQKLIFLQGYKVVFYQVFEVVPQFLDKVTQQQAKFLQQLYEVFKIRTLIKKQNINYGFQFQMDVRRLLMIWCKREITFQIGQLGQKFIISLTKDLQTKIDLHDQIQNALQNAKKSQKSSYTQFIFPIHQQKALDLVILRVKKTTQKYYLQIFAVEMKINRDAVSDAFNNFHQRLTEGQQFIDVYSSIENLKQKLKIDIQFSPHEGFNFIVLSTATTDTIYQPKTIGSKSYRKQSISIYQFCKKNNIQIDTWFPQVSKWQKNLQRIKNLEKTKKIKNKRQKKASDRRG